MSLTLEQIHTFHDAAYVANDLTRERAANDLVFYWISQWDDEMLEESELAFRGEFNIIRKGGRQIMADMGENPIQSEFEPKLPGFEGSAEVLDGLYRTDDTSNSSFEAYETASQETVVCGMGAWELYTEYSSDINTLNHQVIRRRAINEANNVVFWDPNSKRIDKSDAKFVSLIVPYSVDGYKDLKTELTGKDSDFPENEVPSSFAFPAQSFQFPWVGQSNTVIYVVNFYHKKLIKTKLYTLVDEFGESIALWEKDLEDELDEMIDAGFSIESIEERDRWEVTKYIVSGEDILSTEIINGQHIPVIPMYGEHAFVEGAEIWEGITRLAKDPQRLRNFMLSYIADIASTSPRPKPMFFQEQIAGFEEMYNASGADSNFPYYLQNFATPEGEILPGGPSGILPEQTIPSSLLDLTALSREAVEDVVNPGVPQDIADPDTSGKAVLALQARLDMQSMVYQQHLKYAKRRDAEVYASIASEIYDTPRPVKLTLADGTRKDAGIMESYIDETTGDIGVKNILHNVEFEVFSVISKKYSSKKEEELEQWIALYQTTPESDPMKRILMLKIAEATDSETNDIREYARKELIIAGVKKPDTAEEKQMFEEAQKNKQPSAEMVLAQAEMEKAKADQHTARIKEAQLRLDAIEMQTKSQIEMFKAETDRYKAEIDAHVAQATIKFKQAETTHKEIESMDIIMDIGLKKEGKQNDQIVH